MTAATIGHNSGDQRIRVEVRLFNSLSRKGGTAGPEQVMELPAGATVADVLARLALPPAEVFLVLVNGRDVTRRLFDPVNVHRGLEDGDVVALSGPVPFSWGYGAPVV